MKTQNILLAIIACTLIVIALQNAGIISQVKPSDINISEIRGEAFSNKASNFKRFNYVALPITGTTVIAEQP